MNLPGPLTLASLTAGGAGAASKTSRGSPSASGFDTLVTNAAQPVAEPPDRQAQGSDAGTAVPDALQQLMGRLLGELPPEIARAITAKVADTLDQTPGAGGLPESETIAAAMADAISGLEAEIGETVFAALGLDPSEPLTDQLAARLGPVMAALAPVAFSPPSDIPAVSGQARTYPARTDRNGGIAGPGPTSTPAPAAHPADNTQPPAAAPGTVAPVAPVPAMPQTPAMAAAVPMPNGEAMRAGHAPIRAATTPLLGPQAPMAPQPATVAASAAIQRPGAQILPGLQAAPASNKAPVAVAPVAPFQAMTAQAAQTTAGPVTPAPALGIEAAQAIAATKGLDLTSGPAVGMAQSSNGSLPQSPLPGADAAQATVPAEGLNLSSRAAAGLAQSPTGPVPPSPLIGAEPAQPAVDPAGLALPSRLAAAPPPQPTAMVPPSPMAAPAPSPELPQHIARQVRAAEFGDGKMRIELRPHGIGDMEIEIARSESGRMQIVVRAEQAPVLAMIRHDRDALLQALQARGLDTEAADLDFQGFDRGGDQNQPGQDRPGRTFTAPLTDAAPRDETVPAPTPRAPRRGLDILT